MAPCPPRTPKEEPHLSSQDSAPPLWFLLRVSLSPLSPGHLIFCPIYSVPPTFSCMSTAPTSEPTHQRDATRVGRMKRWRTEWLRPLRVQTSSWPLGSPPHPVPVCLPPRLQEPGCGLSPPLRAGAGGTGFIRLRSLLRGSVGRMARSGLLLGLQESGG